MLTIFDRNGVGRPLEIDDYYVRQLSSGLDELIFSMSVHDDDFPLVMEEAQVIENVQNIVYLVKQIDRGNDTAKVVCQIDIDNWKSALLMEYTNGSATPYNTIDAIKPQGWTVEDAAHIGTRRTIPTSNTAQPYNVTPWQVVEAVCNTWNIRVRIDNTRRVITLINPALYHPFGAFATKELNLKRLNYKGKTNSFATRLYAEGADGLTFADINDGKPYVDNHEYADKVVSVYWKDERYTNKESLLDDAKSKLNEMAKPQASYDCDVYDLRAINPELYSNQDFSLFEVITLMDDLTNTAVNHQVVERWDYPHYPASNKVVLATQVPKVQNQVQTIINSFDNSTSTFQQIISAVIDEQTGLITGNHGGYVVLHDSDMDGKPDEILIMDTEDIETATNVWRWNAAGLGYSDNGYAGPFTMAWTIDGTFSADFIKAGTIDADLVRIIHLIVDTVDSISSDKKYKTNIVGGLMTMLYDSTGEGVNYAAKATFGVEARKYLNIQGNAYNGQLVITGQVPNEQETALVEQTTRLGPDGLFVGTSAGQNNGIVKANEGQYNELNLGSNTNTASGSVWINGGEYTLQRFNVKDGDGNTKTIVAWTM